MATTKNFEAALRKLEDSVNQLESGQLPLDQSLKVFTEGVKQADICRQSLRDVELKVEKLLIRDDGSFQRVPINDD